MDEEGPKREEEENFFGRRDVINRSQMAVPRRASPVCAVRVLSPSYSLYCQQPDNFGPFSHGSYVRVLLFFVSTHTTHGWLLAGCRYKKVNPRMRRRGKEEDTSCQTEREREEKQTRQITHTYGLLSYVNSPSFLSVRRLLVQLRASSPRALSDWCV